MWRDRRRSHRVKMMTVSAILLFVALLGGSWLWSPDKDRAELEAR